MRAAPMQHSLFDSEEKQNSSSVCGEGEEEKITQRRGGRWGERRRS